MPSAMFSYPIPELKLWNRFRSSPATCTTITTSTQRRASQKALDMLAPWGTLRWEDRPLNLHFDRIFPAVGILRMI
jgi:hypothetical protein